MRLKEYEGMALFKKYGIPTPNHTLITKPSQIKKQTKPVMIKAQILTGKRKKGGGVLKAEPREVKKAVKDLLKKKINGYPVKEVLIEQMLDIDQEFYVGLIIDGFKRNIKCIISDEGGIDIEELSVSDPKKIHSFDYDKKTLLKNLGAFKHKKQLAEIVSKLYEVMIHFDADLVEINPLILSKGKFIAADSKVTIDDNALYREKDFKEDKKGELTRIEQIAYDHGLQYVDLEGNISVVGCGAGMVMATLDILNHYGGSAADFLDIGGGASVKKMEQSMQILRMRKTKGIFINIFGGITRCNEIAEGIINYYEHHKIKIPMVVRMTGTNDKIAIRLLNTYGIHAFSDMESCARLIVKLTK